jgi:CelD/BcsL family acetyltransferase involved in cellulose biosynthesis
MSSRVITTLQEFENLRPVWEELYRSSANHTPYQSWEWNLAWWKHFGSEGRLRLIVIEENERIIGIAPFFLRTSFFGVPLKHYGFIGQKRTDYLDFIIQAGSEPIFFRELAKHFKELQEDWQFLELKDVPDTSTNLPHLYREFGSVFPNFGLDLQRVCVTVPLTNEWESFLQTLGKRTRKDVGYDRRYLEKNFATEFKILTNSNAVFEGFRDLTSIYEARWVEEKGASRLAEAEVAKFEQEICERFSQNGDYRLYMLYANGKPAAGLSGYVKNDKLYGDIYAHTPELHKYSVGNVLLGFAIEDCISHGWKELDLSRGEEAYKFRWNGQPKRNYHIKIFRNRMAEAKAAFAEGMYEKATQSETLNKMLVRYRKWKYGAVE